MIERPRRPDLDEQFSLHPHGAEDVLRKLLRSDDEPDEDETVEDEES